MSTGTPNGHGPNPNGNTKQLSEDTLLRFMLELHARYQQSEYEANASASLTANNPNSNGHIGSSVAMLTNKATGSGGGFAGGVLSSVSPTGVSSAIDLTTKQGQVNPTGSITANGYTTFMLHIMQAEEKVLEVGQPALLSLALVQRLPTTETYNLPSPNQNQFGFDPAQNSGAGLTVLHLAASFGWAASVEILLSAGGPFVNQFDAVGNTPADWASLHGHTHLLACLISRGGQNNTANIGPPGSGQRNDMHESDTLSSVLHGMTFSGNSTRLDHCQLLKCDAFGNTVSDTGHELIAAGAG
ncbi:hypothetical protein SARC_05063 [Sphaeroforma arctica JP610]|uniref:Uncharacterized protein n=1 Tax=Sphaeroforma arctica JP610 TaxID=667725 RepID=A0A0L0G3A7_9EUKA|nr:hypothetical protein SARC_05063 [Sphaeroforma arctica JP610]KNC82663.1 hypothetical protein SARC_05063 [Sphaeroforma arctica JP610]|eukprot:XP_014156565.1 hypothetical protein SARC_05063 [Sphaeroforma arctica JP610]